MTPEPSDVERAAGELRETLLSLVTIYDGELGADFDGIYDAILAFAHRQRQQAFREATERCFKRAKDWDNPMTELVHNLDPAYMNARKLEALACGNAMREQALDARAEKEDDNANRP